MRRILITIAMAIATAIGASADTSSAIVKKCMRNFTETNAIITTFSINGDRAQGGYMFINRSRFFMELGINASHQIAFDGKVLYNLSKLDRELTISIPTQEELETINPLAFISSLDRNFQQSTSLTDDRVFFSPKDPSRSDIKYIAVKFDEKTAWPVSVEITTSAGTTKLDGFKFDSQKKANVAVTEFQIICPKGYTLIDLR
ncbi:MAG: hypothetical protein K2M97_05265 [Muribaculaceae bacterium]|nr:hypothetical protein [Muribaculaceae bacterium]